ncbi:transposable element Tcb2 transposase [Trichonephila clavipes]|nr:transposable element Tcb2 transposase [Trichonephila clavipes]
MLNGRTELHIFNRGSVIGDRYCEEVLLPHVRLFRGAIGPDFIFMDDNAWPHQTLVVQELLEIEDITRMDWPAYSSDLNPIEHVWDALGKRIASRLHHPEITQQLKQILIEECAHLPQEMLHQLALSMRRRCEATIALFNSKDKPCPEGQALIDFQVQRKSPKHKQYQEGQVLTKPKTERKQGEGEAPKSWRSRNIPYKLRKGKGTTPMASEEERQFTLEQFDRHPSQRPSNVEVLIGDSTVRPKRYRGDEIVMPSSSGCNLRPRRGAKVESRPTNEMRTQQGGPV